MNLKTFIPILLIVGIALIFFMKEENEVVNKQYPSIHGVSLESPHSEIDSLKMSDVKRINANWVAVIPLAFARENDPGIFYNNRGQWWGERLDGTKKLIELAHQNNLQVLLKPHIWLRGIWIGDFNLSEENDWKEWEANYREFILSFARLAEETQVEMLCIGTELKVPSVKRPNYFKDLIKEIRSVYHGKLTYASNWDNYENITFWEDLDYVGIDGYFPLVDESDPTEDQILAAWKPIIRDLQKFSKKTSRNILFTEYGFQSVDGSAGNHWEVLKEPDKMNLELQARAYDCLYQSLYGQTWFSGGFLWKWHFRENAGGPDNPHFTPQGKLAESVIAKWYGSSY